MPETSEPAVHLHLRIPRFSLASVVLAVSLVGCGGGGGGGGGGLEPPPPPPPPAEFVVESGGGACGSAGCGGGDGGGDGGGAGDGGVGAGGGLGAMRNVVATVRKPDGTVLGSAPLRDNLVSLYQRTYTGAFIVEFADDGSGSGEYYDEALRRWVGLDGLRLRILVPEMGANLSANPLTEAAYRYAIERWGSESALTAARMRQANDRVLEAFNLRLPPEYRVVDVTRYAEVVSNTTTAGTLQDTVVGRYGIVLAAMAKSANAFDDSLPRPAVAFARQVARDMADDGQINASFTGSSPAYSPGLPQTLETALVDARSAFGSTSLPEPSEVPSVCFNPQLDQVGTSWEVSYAGSFEGSPVQYDYSYERTSPDEVVYRYLQPDGASVRTTERRGALGPDGQSVSGATTVVEVLVEGELQTTTTEITYSPALAERQFLLAVDEEQRLQSDASITTTIQGEPFESTFAIDRTTRFVGFETVTVPAGTFQNACKYEIVDNLVSTGTTVVWITSSGYGIVVKSLSSEGSTELVSGTVNGEPVR